MEMEPVLSIRRELGLSMGIEACKPLTTMVSGVSRLLITVWEEVEMTWGCRLPTMLDLGWIWASKRLTMLDLGWTWASKRLTMLGLGWIWGCRLLTMVAPIMILPRKVFSSEMQGTNILIKGVCQESMFRPQNIRTINLRLRDSDRGSSNWSRNS